jgi:hypothetical protein
MQDRAMMAKQLAANAKGDTAGMGRLASSCVRRRRPAIAPRI